MRPTVSTGNKSANALSCKSDTYKVISISSSESSLNDYKLTVVSNEQLENTRRKAYKYIM